MTRWTYSQRERRAAAEAGHCVIATPDDEALLAWGSSGDRHASISNWPMDRPTLAAYAKSLPGRHELLERIASLRGRVLACNDPPEPHAYILADIASRAGPLGEGSVSAAAAAVAMEWTA
jgi:hypothetical protein